MNLSGWLYSVLLRILNSFISWSSSPCKLSQTFVSFGSKLNLFFNGASPTIKAISNDQFLSSCTWHSIWCVIIDCYLILFMSVCIPDFCPLWYLSKSKLSVYFVYLLTLKLPLISEWHNIALTKVSIITLLWLIRCGRWILKRAAMISAPWSCNRD